MPDPESSADRIVASLHNVDEKVNALREQRINDPDDLCDKMFKMAAPTLAGLVFGKLFELAWRKSVGRKAVLPDGTTDKRKELALNLVFGVASAGLGALVSQLSDRGSQPLPSIAPNPLKPWNPLDLPISANFARSANNPTPTSIFRSVRFRSAIEAAVGTARNCTKLRLEGMRLRAKMLAQLRGWDINSQHE